MSTNKGQNFDDPPPYSSGCPPEAANGIVGQPILVQHQQQQLLQAPQVFRFGPVPADVICPSCAVLIRTTIKTEATTKTHLMAIILLILFWPCACVPYCVDSCQSSNHYCPNCDAFIGSYQT